MLSLILGGKDSRDHWLGDITSQFLNNDGIKIGWQRYHLHGFLGIFDASYGHNIFNDIRKYGLNYGVLFVTMV